MDYTIERLGHQGDGIAPGPLFAPMTLPGEVVTGTPDGTRLRDIRITTPSADRVRPPCRHFKSCGGCAVMHAADPFVADWKLGIVRAALAAQGLTADLRPIQTSPSHSRRRAAFAARRTKSGAMVGFHGRASDTIVEIPDCHLLDPALLAGVEAVRALAQVGASRKSVLTVHTTVTLEGLDLDIRGGKPLDQALRTDLAQLAEAHRLARIAWEGDIVAQRVAPAIAMGPARVTPPPGAFLQATEHGQSALTAAVVEAVGPAARIVDLFAGCGTFALPLATGAAVHAVEGAGDMLAALAHGWRHATGVKAVTTETRDLFRNPLLPDELARYDAVVIDPPRAGAEAQTRQLAQAKPPVIAFVSCNPVTFARDARMLTDAGYVIDWVQVVDQFRWSPHVELAARFRTAHM